MAISIGDAVLKLGVDTKDMDRGLQGLTKRVQQHRKAIGLAMIGIGAAIIAVGVTSIKTWAAMGDEVQKMALRTGFSTEALSELRHAAKISGASLESLEKATKRMSKTIVDASEGMATYIRAFERIGLSVEELMELSPEEQFFKIAMAIGELEDHTLKAATAQDIFGRAGTQLLPLISSGADGIERLREEAHKLGVVFDEEAAKEAANLNDKITTLNESMDGLKKVVAEALAPTVAETADSIKNMIVSIRELMEKYPQLTDVIIKASMAFAGLMFAVGGLMVSWKVLAPVLSLIGLGLVALLHPMGAIIASIGWLIAAAFVVAKNWDIVTRDLTNRFNDIRKAAEFAFEGTKNVIMGVVQWVLTLRSALLGLWNLLMRFLTFGRGGAGGARPPSVSREEAMAGRGYGPYGTLTEPLATRLKRGGIVRRPTLAMLGEAGPEAVIPLRGRQAPAIQNIIHVYIGEREVGDLLIDHVTEQVSLRGGF